MSIVSGLFNQNITSINSISKSAYGDPTLTTVYSDVPCRFVGSVGKTISVEAVEKSYRAEVWLLADYTIQSDYQIIFGGETYYIVTIESPRDLAGAVDHQKLYLV